MTKLIDLLSKEAKENKAFNAFAHVCALRKRARGQITMVGLAQRMKKEGFNYSSAEYEKILKFLASHNLGKLKTDNKGRVIALDDIKISLQSLGAAAVSGGDLRTWKQRNQYKELPAAVSTPRPLQSEPKSPPSVYLTLVVNGKAVNVKIPKDFTERDIADLLLSFRDSNSAGVEL